MTIERGSLLWQYLSPNQRSLYEDGIFLVKDSSIHVDKDPTDFSYMVFPFAKLYEGFLKQLLLDLNIISESEYYSDRFRIGKSLSPNFERHYRRSAFAEIKKRFGEDLAFTIWNTWKEGRNLVFHYFPHNFRSLTKGHAILLIDEIIKTMDLAVRKTKIRPRQDREVEFKRVGKWRYNGTEGGMH